MKIYSYFSSNLNTPIMRIKKTTNQNWIIFGLLACLCFMPYTIYAKFCTLEDVSIKYDFYNRDVTINKDGSSEDTVELQMELLKDQAKTLASKYTIDYNSESSSIDIIEAKSIFKEKGYKVTKNMIEDKSIANNMLGFDDIKQISISFPIAQIGTKIYLKYKIRTTKIPVDGEFFSDYYFGLDGYWQNACLTFNSAIPLQMEINDPFSKLSVEKKDIKTGQNFFYKAEVKLKQPLINAIINEMQSSSLNPKKLTSISVSSLSTWQKLGADQSNKYNEILNQPSPLLITEIINLARKEKGSINQINQITNLLNEKLQYFGDWRSLNGKFIPQNLDAIVKKQSGDCKDFAVITTKILKGLGYKANIALVFRGVGYQPLQSTLPTLSVFNHAIVKVVDTEGITYWIDPTNDISMAGGLFPDIAGQYALVLDGNKSVYEKIPEIKEDHAKILETTIVEQNNTAFTTIKFFGQEAMNLTGLALYRSKENIIDSIYNAFALHDIASVNRISSDIPELKSRIVKPLTVSINYIDPRMFAKTNFGSAYLLNTNFSFLRTLTNVDTKADVNDLYLGFARTLKHKTIFKNIKTQNLQNLNLQLTNPYVSLSRKCYIEGDDSVVVEQAQVHKSWVENEALKTQKFQEIQKNLQESIRDTLVVLPNI